MLEGLEINIKQLKDLFNEDDDTFRLDSEHYRKEYLRSIHQLSHLKTLRIKDVISVPVMTGHTPSMKIDRYYGGDIKFIKTDNLRANKIAGDFTHHLSEEGNKLLSRSSLRKNDVITTIIGATYEIVGRTSIIQSDILPANINQNIALIRVNDKLLNPSYLNIYLNTKIGRNLLHYHSRQTEQVNLNCREVERVIIPVFSELGEHIEQIVIKIEELKKTGKQLYAEAEEILLTEIGLKDFSPSAEPVNIKSFSSSFTGSGRIDAEYFQRKYESIEDKILTHLAGYTTIDAEFKLVKGTSRREKNAYNYIEISDVNVSDGAASFNRIDIQDLPANAKQEVKRGDLLISKVRPNRGAIAIIDFDDTDLIVSGAFTVLREKASSKFSNETLKVLLRTNLYREWMLKFNIGTQYPVIRDEDILSLPIPIVLDESHKRISSLVKQSFTLKKQSETLLETAKKAVEIAIEHDEGAALKYIKDNN